MATSYDNNDVIQCLMNLEISSGDCIFLHTALRSLGDFINLTSDNKLLSLLNIFLNSVGSLGTIVVPTFNFSFCKGEPFDIDLTPCDGMGAFSEFVRTDVRSHRSKHPFHSVAAIGRNSQLIASSIGYSEFSEGSFFDQLLHLKTKIVFFGIPFVGTFVHLAEERAKVPYRHWKTFSGDFKDGEKIEKKLFNFYARNLGIKPEPRVDRDEINVYLRETGIIKSVKLGEGEVSVCDSGEMVAELIRKFTSDPTFALVKH